MEQDIILLEKSFWQAIVDDDTEKAISLLGEKSVVTGPQGVNTLTHDDYRKMAANAGWTLKAFELQDIKVIFPAPHVAVIAYTVHMDMIVKGKKTSLAAADSSVWVNQAGSWLNVHHTEAIIGDPFGQDRKAA